jgi:hypothetical protein
MDIVRPGSDVSRAHGFLTVEKQTMIGGLDVDDFTYSSRSVVGWSSTGLALQPIMGLLPQRRPWLGGSGFTRVAVGWETVMPSRISVKPMPSWHDERGGSIGACPCKFDSTGAHRFAQRWFCR